MTVKPSFPNSSSRSERGATLVEMLVAMAISVLVFGVITTALVQFVLVTRWGNSLLQTSNDIQVTSLWLGRDAPEAYSFTPGSGAVYGTLDWEDSSHQYRYSYDASHGSLVRTHLENGSLQSTNVVARHIASQNDVVFNLNGKLLTVTITSTSGEETETASIQFALRTR
jgi:type II secretory pathway component PulJ